MRGSPEQVLALSGEIWVRLARGPSVEAVKTKLILKCGLPLGDLVLLTAAVRDLHACYPGKFETGVGTLCPELWENNPYILPVDDGEPGAEVVDCAYPLVQRSNSALYHVIPGAAQPQPNFKVSLTTEHAE